MFRDQRLSGFGKVLEKKNNKSILGYTQKCNNNGTIKKQLVEAI